MKLPVYIVYFSVSDPACDDAFLSEPEIYLTKEEADHAADDMKEDEMAYYGSSNECTVTDEQAGVELYCRDITISSDSGRVFILKLRTK